MCVMSRDFIGPAGLLSKFLKMCTSVRSINRLDLETILVLQNGLKAWSKGPRSICEVLEVVPKNYCEQNRSKLSKRVP